MSTGRDIPPNFQLHQHLHGARMCRKLYSPEMESKRNTMICLTKDKKRVYIAFSGTQRMAHWLNNINIALDERGVHSGFKSFADNCYEELATKMAGSSKSDLEKIESMTLVSHSMGASALIVLLYNELLRNSLNDCRFEKNIKEMDIDVVMFGAPKTGNTAFSNHFNYMLELYPNIKIYRYIIEYDLVTQFPPLSQYTHVCDGIPLYEQKRIMYIVYNHSLSSYINNIKSLILLKGS